LSLSLLIALVTEVLVRYLVSLRISQKTIFNSFLINTAYLLIRPFYYPLHKIVKPKKKIFANSEKDVARFVNNLAAEDILEKGEASLVQSALKFDEQNILSVATP
jgi:CBS domain containing-hemolysin-like protein